jgi:sec-independent protein translocase protein TatB
MFDFDAGKLIVIGVVALVVIPSKDLPRVMRQLGQLIGKTRRMAAEFQGQFMDAMREAELADLRKDLKQEVDSAIAGVGLNSAFDPMAEARKQIAEVIEPPPAPPAAAPEQPAQAEGPAAAPEPQDQLPAAAPQNEQRA